MSQIGIGAYGMMAQGVATMFTAHTAKKAQKYNNAAAQAQADIYRINADTMELAYQSRLYAAESEYQRESMQAGQAKARQKVSLAANGVALGVGSAAEQTASTDITKQINLNRLEANAKQEAWGYRTKAIEYRGAAAMKEAQIVSPSMVGRATLLQGASQIAYGWAVGRMEKSLKADAAKDAKTANKKANSSGSSFNPFSFFFGKP